ncbi:MAG TPA: hypothetical protein VGD45_20245 [Steroidobacter sp.]|uniref:hypothetical protein n=1 Tax=Steroidobacter sp. TaxID=1978227 RepID=UPI002ED7F1D1
MSINKGDIVTVNMEASATTLGAHVEVVCTPNGPGDFWGFRDTKTAKEFWTSEPITIYKRDADQR